VPFKWIYFLKLVDDHPVFLALFLCILHSHTQVNAEMSLLIISLLAVHKIIKEKLTVIGGTINWARRAIHTIVKDDRGIPLTIYQDHVAKNALLMSCLFPNISTGSKHEKTLDIVTYSDGSQYHCHCG